MYSVTVITLKCPDQMGKAAILPVFLLQLEIWLKLLSDDPHYSGVKNLQLTTVCNKHNKQKMNGDNVLGDDICLLQKTSSILASQKNSTWK